MMLRPYAYWIIIRPAPITDAPNVIFQEYLDNLKEHRNDRYH